jgi:hypothetical protein
MKEWQKGFDLDYLKGIASKFEKYNSHTLSPFTQVKKNNIASMLDAGSIHIHSEDTMI